MGYKDHNYVFEKREGKTYYSFDTTTASPFHEIEYIKKRPVNPQLSARFTERASITIDGMSLEQLLKNEGKFAKYSDGRYFCEQEELSNFLKTHLLFRMPENQQDDALIQLKLLLGQGGLSPATAAADQAFNELNKKGVIGQKFFCSREQHQGEARIFAPALDPSPNNLSSPVWQKRALNFLTTEKGFILQEVVTQEALVVVNGKEILKIYPDDPKGEKPYVYQALMTIDVDLTDNEGKLTAQPTVTHCGINYGSARAKELLDTRGLLAKFIDAAKKLFHMDGSKIRDLSKGRDDEEENVENQGCSFCSY
ncbi:hypothetical protein [Legionella sp. WA2022007384]